MIKHLVHVPHWSSRVRLTTPLTCNTYLNYLVSAICMRLVDIRHIMCHTKSVTAL